MPGFMGLRGLEIKKQHDIERDRKGDTRVMRPVYDAELRAREKAQEILKNQARQGQGGSQGQDRDTDVMCRNQVVKNGYAGIGPDVSRARVQDIMSGRVAVLTFDDNLLTVQAIFSSVRFHHLPVVDEDGGIIGIMSDRDFLRLASPFFGTINEQTRDKEIMLRKVGTVMTRKPVCIGTDDTVADAIRIMNGRKISCLPVVDVDGRKLLGILTWKDIVRALCPRCFDPSRESNRLQTGVHINPKSTESARLKAKTAESARLRAARQEEKPVEKPGRPGETEAIVEPPFDSDRAEATP